MIGSYQNNENRIEIPIIDFSNIKNIENENQIILQLKNACKQYGFFYITNHEIMNEINFDKLLQYSKIFFSLPNEFKEKFKMDINKRDYLGYYGLNFQNTYKSIDHKEGLYLDIEKPIDIENESNGIYIYPTKKDEFKYGLIGFKDFMINYIKQVTKLGDEILKLISKSLELPINYFKNNYTFDNHALLFQLIKYPKSNYNNPNNNQDAMAVHTDWNIITLLYQDSTGGLQIKNGNGFIEANPIKNALICNIGDIIEIITQGYYISNYHKVINNKSNNDRYSFPLFIGPQDNIQYKVIESFNNTNIINKNNRDIQFFEYRGTYKEYLEKNMNNAFKQIYKEE